MLKFRKSYFDHYSTRTLRVNGQRYQVDEFYRIGPTSRIGLLFKF